MNTPEVERTARALLLGAAVGDALGLPAEGLRPGTIQRRWHGDWRMRLCFGCGLFSDDTEHHLMVAQSLISEPLDAQRFQERLGWKLRWWFASLPAGVGLATARACLKLWLGFPPARAAVISGGAGPAMRSAILGALLAHEPARRRAFVEATAGITHRGWQASLAALAVAESIALTVNAGRMPESGAVLGCLRNLSPESEWGRLIDAMDVALREKRSVSEFAKDLGLDRGISGYALHVVPMALYAWLRHPGTFREPLVAILDCGGDTDTAGAVVGALAAAAAGPESIPTEWVDSIADWPRSVGFIHEVARRAAQAVQTGKPGVEASLPWPFVLLRNVVFLVIVLAHGLRRLLPPY